jgi:hypothetical protein
VNQSPKCSTKQTIASDNVVDIFVGHQSVLNQRPSFHSIWIIMRQLRTSDAATSAMSFVALQIKLRNNNSKTKKMQPKPSYRF